MTEGREGIEGLNRAALEKLHKALAGPFSIHEAAAALSVPDERAARLLRYLSARGWLSRVRRGLYTTVPLGASAPSSWREDPWLVASSVFAPCYIGGWSACEHWSLTEQVFQDVVVATARPVRSVNIEVQGQRFRLKHMPERKQFGTRVVWKGQVAVKVSDPHRTVVDLLDDPAIGGGMRHVASVLQSYWESEHRSDDQLIAYARRLGNRTVYKRLGFLLEELRLSAPKVIAACHRRISAGLSALDPGVSGKGRILKRWNLRVNVQLGDSEARS